MNAIPPITEPMGKHWDQPPIADIQIDDTHALMGQKTFDALAEYSASFPSGVYPGKMWKRHDGLHDDTCPVEMRRWLLVWFGESKIGPGFCLNNFREIIIA